MCIDYNGGKEVYGVIYTLLILHVRRYDFEPRVTFQHPSIYYKRVTGPQRVWASSSVLFI
jgi:hypothetical protein